MSSNNITATELLERLNKGEKLNLLDVREPIEYHSFNIKGINIPLSKLNENIHRLDWNKNDEVIVICKVGLRSQTAKSILQENGYHHIRNLTGGLIAIQKLK